MAKILNDTTQAADLICSEIGNVIKMATPLGLGKPNHLLNALYEKAKYNPDLSLKIYTALSLNPPKADNPIAEAFLKPFADRQWGIDYPHPNYAKDAEAGNLAKNVHIHEFYFKAGAALKSRHLQKNYQSINYTRVAEAVYNEGINLIVQLVAKSPDGSKYSLSCNPDVTLDLNDLYKEAKRSVFIVGVVHPDLPYLGGDAEVPADFFNIILEDKKAEHQLFALPRMPISEADHAIGFFASQLVADDGTLQIGIGSLSDAVVSSMLLRHKNNDRYQNLVNFCWKFQKKPESLPLENKPFEKGIYGLSEMVTDAYMHFRQAGILKRQVVDEKSGYKTYLHGAFFLGSKDFYQWLRDLKGDDFNGIRMTRVSKVNDLYDPNELLLRRQRKNARFLNTCMQVTLLGGAASETLEDGRVVSGVGGQYNFIAMSEELKNARSALMLRSTRESQGKRSSNIIWSHGHLTIPRHLRDIVITEYGMADIRNKSDEDCIRALIEIADSEFQEELVDLAKKNRKLSQSYKIPDYAKNNTPQNLQKLIDQGRAVGAFSPFALGSDFTPAEQKLALALERLKSKTEASGVISKIKIIPWALSAFKISDNLYVDELERMNLLKPRNLKEKFLRLLILKSLQETQIKEFS